MPKSLASLKPRQFGEARPLSVMEKSSNLFYSVGQSGTARAS